MLMIFHIGLESHARYPFCVKCNLFAYYAFSLIVSACVCVFCIIEDHFSLTVCCQNKFLPTPDNFYWTHYQQISSHFGVGGIKVFNALSKHSIKHQFSPPSSEYFIDVTVFGIRDLVSSLNLRFVLYYDIKSNRQTNRRLGCIAQKDSLTHIVILGMDFLWTILMLNFFQTVLWAILGLYRY